MAAPAPVSMMACVSDRVETSLVTSGARSCPGMCGGVARPQSVSRGGYIHQASYLLLNHVWLTVQPRPAQDQGDAHRFLGRSALLHQAVAAQVIAVVAGIHPGLA